MSDFSVAIDWVVERQCMKTDKARPIVNGLPALDID